MNKNGNFVEVLVNLPRPLTKILWRPFKCTRVTRPCSSAKNISKESVGQYNDLKNVSDRIHLSGGAIVLLIGTDFVEVSLISTVSGKPGELIAKRYCFGWYVMGQFESNGSTLFEIQSIEEGTVSVVEDIKKRLHQDPLGVKPTNSVLTLKTC